MEFEKIEIATKSRIRKFVAEKPLTYTAVIAGASFVLGAFLL